MDKTKFESLHNFIAKNACKMLKNKGSIVRTSFIGKGTDIYLYTQLGDMDGEDIAKDVTDICSKVGADFVFHASEAWSSATLNARPLHAPDRKEILMISGEHKDHGKVFISYDIHRNNAGKITKLTKSNIEFDNLGGRMTNLLGGSGDETFSFKVKRKPGYKSHFRMPGYTIH